MPSHKNTRPDLTLKAAILENGTKQYVLARRAGIDHTRLSQIVNGRRPSTSDERRAIAKVLHKSIDDLFPTQAA